MADTSQSAEDQDVAATCATVSRLLGELAARYGSIRPARVAAEHALPTLAE